MFAVKDESALGLPAATGASSVLAVPRAGGRALRRRFNKLSCAGWLPHFRSFVSGLPRSRSERRSEDRLITGTRVPHLALPPTLGACRMIAVFFALLSVA
jgi:hypothetical protein